MWSNKGLTELTHALCCAPNCSGFGSGAGPDASPETNGPCKLPPLAMPYLAAVTHIATNWTHEGTVQGRKQ
jgi:hypothetical protein